jgi:hypothetical protein
VPHLQCWRQVAQLPWLPCTCARQHVCTLTRCRNSLLQAGTPIFTWRLTRINTQCSGCKRAATSHLRPFGPTYSAALAARASRRCQQRMLASWATELGNKWKGRSWTVCRSCAATAGVIRLDDVRGRWVAERASRYRSEHWSFKMLQHLGANTVVSDLFHLVDSPGLYLCCAS